MIMILKIAVVMAVDIVIMSKIYALNTVSSREVGGLGHSIRRGAEVNKVHSGFLIRYRHSRLCHKKIDPWKMRKDQNCYYPKKVQKV